jgi:hypothetical protein
LHKLVVSIGGVNVPPSDSASASRKKLFREVRLRVFSFGGWVPHENAFERTSEKLHASCFVILYVSQVGGHLSPNAA